jgi:hypothetical protein
MSPVFGNNTGSFYRKGDIFTTGKSGITGRLEEIVSVRPNLTKIALRTSNNQLRWAMVKIG